MRYNQGSRGGLAIYSTIGDQRFETQAFYLAVKTKLLISPALLKAVKRKDNSYNFSFALTKLLGNSWPFKEIFFYLSNLPYINLFLEAFFIKVNNLNITFRNFYLVIISLS